MNNIEGALIDNNRRNVSNLNAEIIFKGDSFFVFIFKKTQKILVAVYLITGFLNDGEPLKWNLRKIGSKTVSFILEYYNARNEFDHNKLRSCVFELSSLIEVAEHGGLISNMNSVILKEELRMVMEVIDSHESKSRIALPRDFFEIGVFSDDAKKNNENRVKVEDAYKGHSQGHEMSLRMSDKAEKRSNNQNGDLSLKDRKEKILSFLKKTKEANIKEISLLIKGCSEKTIQRDLMSLIDEGVIRKTGERRWSKYQIVS